MRCVLPLVLAACTSTATVGPPTRRYVVGPLGDDGVPKGEACRRACAAHIGASEDGSCEGVSVYGELEQRLGYRAAVVCVVRRAEAR
jgi:hypothetical protein